MARGLAHAPRDYRALCSRFRIRLAPKILRDATQDALLAIHNKRHTYQPSRPFGAWAMAIARYKWIDRIRDASRFAALSLDDEIAIEDHGEATICAATLDKLLDRLKPAQASVIRLVKLRGLSIARASGATGQSAAGTRYEDTVLGLLGRHGGSVERRMRGTDSATEVQLIRFRSRAGYESFMVDPNRLGYRDGIGDAAPTTRVIEVRDL